MRPLMSVGVLRVLLLQAVATQQVPPSPGAPSTTLEAPLEGQEVPGSPTVFSQQNNTELRAQVGTTAVLHCFAHNVGENTVSWIRRRDYHLLTVGSQAYSSDDRFQVRYIKHENDWQLHIRYVQVRDQGVYECQVSSHPPISLFSTLHVLQATSEILGGPEKYMTVGSSLRLVCVLRDNTQPPSYVFWYHDQHMINYHATREVRVENNGGLSVLFLSNVRPADSGNYSCAPSNARPAHIYIHVLKGGETPAAIHSGSESGTTTSTLPLPLLLSLVLCLASTYLSRASCSAVSGLKTTQHTRGTEEGVSRCSAWRGKAVSPPPGVMSVRPCAHHPHPRPQTPASHPQCSSAVGSTCCSRLPVRWVGGRVWRRGGYKAGPGCPLTWES
ncbi:neural cell adhesion molecule 2-like [Procambarus clarkii]|uniref:neural cell adhesion molecule 2-like n=1 Tax=Procambarus clarkii TaxID=6728 RepID=UPI00374200C1